MRNWFQLSDAALIRSADNINKADAALKNNDIIAYQLHIINASRYQLISRYCMLRARQMFSL